MAVFPQTVKTNDDSAAAAARTTAHAGIGRTRRAVGVAVSAAIGVIACASKPPALPDTQRIHTQAVNQPVDAIRVCLIKSLSATGAVAGIQPATTTTRLPDGVRIEQWFTNAVTHERTAFEVRALSADSSLVQIYLLQRHGQYAVGGFDKAARDALARCAGPP